MAQEVTPSTVVAFGAETNIPHINRNAQNLASHLRVVNEQGNGEATFKSLLRETGEQSDYSPTQGILIESKFGAGAAVVNDRGQVEVNSNASLEQKANIELSKKLIADNNVVIDYLELSTESDVRARDQRLTRMKTEKRVELETMSYEQLRQKALDVILTNPNNRDILETIPELASISRLSTEDKRLILEMGIAKDPALRKSLSQEMNAIKDATKNLPEITTDGEKKKLEDQKKEATEKFKNNIASVVGRLKRVYDDKISEQKIIEVFEKSPDKDIALDTLTKEICTKIELGEEQIKNISKYGQLQVERETLRQRLKESPTWKDTNAAKKEYDSITADIESKDREIKTITETNDFDDNLNKYQTLARTLDGISTYISEGIEQSLEITNLDIQINRVPTADTKLQQLDRLAEESRILGQLEGAMGRAMADTLDIRRTKMIELQEKDLGEKAEKDKTGAIKKVLEARNKNGIEDDERNRTRIIHADKLGDDVRYLSYHTEDGIKRLMLRDLDFNGVDWRAVDIDSGLTAEQKNQLESAYTTADTYRDRLMTDYFTAVQMGGGLGAQRLFKGIGRELSKDLKIGKYKDIRWEGNAANLTLRNHEWQLLDQKYGKQIDEALNKSKEGSDYLKKLTEKGIIPSFKLKWLLYILIALGILVGAPAIMSATAK